MVECNLAKVEVEGSNPFTRSTTRAATAARVIYKLDTPTQGAVAKWLGPGLQIPYTSVRIRSAPPDQSPRKGAYSCVGSGLLSGRYGTTLVEFAMPLRPLMPFSPFSRRVVE